MAIGSRHSPAPPGRFTCGATDRGRAHNLDNTSLAVKEVLAGRDRVQTDAFEAFRGAYPFAAEFCAPAKGWEQGFVEPGVKYVRNLVFRPRLVVESWAALNAAILTELEADRPARHLDDGRSVEDVLTRERQHLPSQARSRSGSHRPHHAGAGRLPPRGAVSRNSSRASATFLPWLAMSTAGQRAT